MVFGTHYPDRGDPSRPIMPLPAENRRSESKPVSGPSCARSRVLVVAQSAEVKLLGPTSFGIPSTKLKHHVGRKLGMFFGRNGASPSRFFKNSSGGLSRNKSLRSIDSYHGPRATALSMKEIVSLTQSSKKGIEIGDINITGCRKTCTHWLNFVVS